MQANRIFATASLFFFIGFPLGAQNGQPLNQRVLVVYNTTVADSIAVANYYVTKRAIPSANVCAISPPATTYVSSADFDNTVKTPIKACLNAVGASNILYIVFSYQTPYGRIGNDGNGYSLDQSISDIWDQYNPMILYPYPDNPHPYYAGAQSQGNVYQPFVSLADYRSQPGAMLLYSVWRLDAATPAIARGLVDKAMQAESSGLTGQICIDRNRGDLTGQSDAGYLAGDWDLHEAALFAAQAGFAVTEDSNDAEFGTPPAALRCDNAALYSGWYSLDHYNDAFSWNPGAIGWHLDSASALDPRGGTNWSANALLKGITVTSGAVKEPYLEALPAPDGVFRNLFEGANVGDAFLRNTPYVKWMIVNMGDPLYRPFPRGFPAFDRAANPQTSLTLNPQFLVGGGSSTGTVTLAAPAPPGGAVVNLVSGTPAYAAVPASVTVPSGSRTATFPIDTTLATANTFAQISATSGFVARTNTLGVLPLLGVVTVTPGTVSGPATVMGAVYLNDYAPPGGALVTLTSDHPAMAAVPASVLVTAGSVSAKFNIVVNAAASNTAIVITAANAGAASTGNLTVNAGVTGDAITVSPASLSFSYAAGGATSPQTIFVAGARSNFSFTASASANWLSVSPQNGVTPASITVSVSSNLAVGSYAGAITVSGSGIAAPAVVPIALTVTGAPCNYSIGSSSQSFGVNGGGGSIAVSAGSGCTWSASSNAGWLAISSGVAGAGNGTVTFTVAANGTSISRTAILTAAGQTFTVTQAGIASTGVMPTAVFHDIFGGMRLTSFGSTVIHDSGGIFGSDPGMARSASGDTYAVERDNYNGIWLNVFSAGAQAWAGWNFAGGILPGVPAVTTAPNGTAWFAGRDSYGAYYLNSYSGTFSGWRPLGGVFASDPAIASTPDGSVYLIARDSYGGMWSGRYIPGTGFQGWIFGGGIAPGTPSAAAGADNAVYVSMRDPSNGIWMAQLRGNSWGQWQPGGGVMAADPQSASAGNAIYVAAVDASGGVWYNRFGVGTGNNWQGWTGVGGIMQSVSAAVTGSKLYLAAAKEMERSGGGT
ncbi:MAG: TIGR03790 family protein, partial [Acidobacteriota bacterium]|nr:TIGR03790 family protein [Acidobacteriota bacterium]